MDEATVHLIRDFGFPVVMCMWFMFRMERRQDKIRDRLSDIVGVLKMIARTMDLSEQEQKLLEDSGK